ncbi:hypothetical protein [Rufibacter soli]|jgi:hypothetical protein
MEIDWENVIWGIVLILIGSMSLLIWHSGEKKLRAQLTTKNVHLVAGGVMGIGFGVYYLLKTI